MAKVTKRDVAALQALANKFAGSEVSEVLKDGFTNLVRFVALIADGPEGFDATDARICLEDAAEAFEAVADESRFADEDVDDLVELPGVGGEPCLSGWTGDRCQFPIGHKGPHSNR